MKISTLLRYRSITAGAIALVVAAVTAISFSTSASASDFRAGFHYTDHGTPLTQQPVVTEYISVFCPACNHLNGYNKELHAAMPWGIPKRRAHVDFIRGTDMDGLIGIARMIALSEIYASKMKSDPVDDLFKVVHEYRGRINAQIIDQIIDIHDELNPEFDVRSAFKSDEVNELAMLSTQNQRRMQQAGVLNSVPTLMVNGRYQINLQNLNPNTMFDDINALVQYLTNKDYQ